MSLANKTKLIEINLCQDLVKFLHISWCCNFLKVFFRFHYFSLLLCLLISNLNLKRSNIYSVLLLVFPSLFNFFSQLINLWILLENPRFKILINTCESFNWFLESANLGLNTFKSLSLRNLRSIIFNLEQVELQIQFKTLQRYSSLIMLLPCLSNILLDLKADRFLIAI